MKTNSKYRIWIYSVVSGAVLALFLIIGVGSDGTWDPYGFTNTEYDSEDLDDGRRKNTYDTYLFPDDVTSRTYTGKQDTQGRWEGPLEIVTIRGPSPTDIREKKVERVHMVNGERHGTGTITEGDWVEHVCWDRNRRVNCLEGDLKMAAPLSAWDILAYEFPWYVDWMNAFGFDDDFIESYVDSLEMHISSNDGSEGDFYDYYDDAKDVMSESPTYDTISLAHVILMILQGMEEMRNRSEFRMAVIDQHRQEELSTHEMILEKYPGYRELILQMEVNEVEFEDFCWGFDSIMYTWETLDQSDPFFVDSVENRMNATLNLMSSESDTIEETVEYKAARGISKYRNAHALFVRKAMSLFQDDGPSRAEVADVVGMTFLIYMLDGDKIMEALHKVYHSKESIVVLPVLTTNLESHLSASSVELRGAILDDGGGEITTSGIAWSTHYSPTVDDQVLSAAATGGSFIVVLDGLTEGQTYYARTFASNSAGTSYGNNVEFIASVSQGDAPPEVPDRIFHIYPNPASSSAKAHIIMDRPGEVALQIYDMKGSLVEQSFLGLLPSGENLIDMDLGKLERAAYHCKLTIGDEKPLVRILVVN